MPLLVAIAVAIVVSCAVTDRVDEHIDINPDQSICEREAALRGAECARVYAFAMRAINPLGHVELCVPEPFLEAAQHEHGVAWPSDDERFARLHELGLDPPCFWACPTLVAGCNAFSGCYCPEAAP